MPEPVDKKENIDLPKPQPSIEKVKLYKFVVVDSTVIEDVTTLMDLADNTKNDQPPDISDGDVFTINVTKKNDPIDLNKGEDYIYVPEMPEYIGGESSMYDFLKQHIVYPEDAKVNGISGKVYVKFVVGSDGSICNITLLKDIGGGCGDEAVRVVKLMPKWKPGKQNGVCVRVQYVLPVNFILEN